MSDDKVRLWRAFIDGWVYGEKPQVEDYPHAEEGVWRPRADDDAREERLRAAESAARVCREDAEANATRAERIERMFHQAERERDEWKDAAQRMDRGMNRVEADRYEWKARATKAEAEAALLRARIDAETGGGK